MVFIETALQPLTPSANQSPVLRVDPAGPEAGSAEAPTTDDRSADAPWTGSSPTTEPPRAGGRDLESTFRAPALALVAAVAIIAGYRWLGMIPASSSRLSSLVFDRTGALVLAVVIASVALAVTRPAGHGRRPWHHRLVVLAGLVVVVASVVVAWLPAAGTRYALGACDLVLALAIAGVLIIDERHRRQADASDPLSSSAPVATDRALPIT